MDEQAGTTDDTALETALSADEELEETVRASSDEAAQAGDEAAGDEGAGERASGRQAAAVSREEPFGREGN